MISQEMYPEVGLEQSLLECQNLPIPLWVLGSVATKQLPIEGENQLF